MNGKSAKVVLNAAQGHQTVESVNIIVQSILRKAGCEACGRLALLELAFQGDPAPEQAKAGAISVITEGF